MPKEIGTVLGQIHPDHSLTREGMAMVIDQIKETMRKILQCAFNLNKTADMSDEVADEVLGYVRTSGAEVRKVVNIGSRSIQTAVRLVVLT
jgi:hypothetical protein